MERVKVVILLLLQYRYLRLRKLFKFKVVSELFEQSIPSRLEKLSIPVKSDIFWLYSLRLVTTNASLSWISPSSLLSASVNSSPEPIVAQFVLTSAFLKFASGMITIWAVALRLNENKRRKRSDCYLFVCKEFILFICS